MPPPTTRADLLATIETERAAWEGLLAEIGESRMTEPGAAGSWSFKDVVAHLSDWRRRTVDRLEAARRHEAPPPAPWPAGLDEESDDDIERINDWFYERSKDRPLAAVLAEARQQFGQMSAAVEALPERDLFEPGRFAWLEGYPMAAVVTGSFGHLHEEHEPAIRSWLAGLNARA